MSGIEASKMLPDNDPTILYVQERRCCVYGCNSTRFEETEVDRVERYSFKNPKSGKMKIYQEPVTITVHACRKCKVVQEDLPAIQHHEHDPIECTICKQIWTSILRESIDDNKAKKKDRFAIQNKDGSIDLVDELGMGDPTSERSEAVLLYIRERDLALARKRSSRGIMVDGYKSACKKCGPKVHEHHVKEKFYIKTPNLTKCWLGDCGRCNTCKNKKEMEEYRSILETKDAMFATKDWERKKRYIKNDERRMLAKGQTEFTGQFGITASMQDLRTFKKYFGSRLKKKRSRWNIRGTQLTMPYDDVISLEKRWFQLNKGFHECIDGEADRPVDATCPQCHEMECIDKQFIADKKYIEPRWVQVGVWNEAMQRTEWNHSVDLELVTGTFVELERQKKLGLREYPWTENFEISIEMLVDASNEKFIDDSKIWSTNIHNQIHVSTSTDSKTGINIGTRSDDSLEDGSESEMTI